MQRRLIIQVGERILEPDHGHLTCKNRDVPRKARHFLDESVPGWTAAKVYILYYDAYGRFHDAKVYDITNKKSKNDELLH